MKIKIHRGTKEIGGSCVELWTANTRIIIDFGMPLVNDDGSEFDFKQYENLNVEELRQNYILPDINGLYPNDSKNVDAILLSHAHIDHYGFTRFIAPDIKFYMGEATHEIIKLSEIFTPVKNNISNFQYFEKSVPFSIGDFKITPYWMDHSAFDAYAFLIEADGKKVFYSGDFRGHGRKSKVLKRLLKQPPTDIDYLLLEGTQVGREETNSKSEDELETELVSLFQQKNKINMIYTSGQNIDRLVTIFRACLRTGKTLAIDPYVATVLKQLSQYGKLPYPSENFKNIRVFFPGKVCYHLKNNSNEKLFYQFKKYKITTDEISNQYENIVMLIRPSIKAYLSKIDMTKGNMIYSLWKGYLKKPYTKEFIDFFTNQGFDFQYVHTSGHADLPTLKAFVNYIKPSNLIPIHTFKASEYKNIFEDTAILEISDREEYNL